MIQTTMQMMLDDLLAKRDVYENAKMYECVATLETSIEIAKFLLEKEKEQIINAHINGQSEFDMLQFRDINKTLSDNYYNQTYNK
jgi:hypothetical protein